MNKPGAKLAKAVVRLVGSRDNVTVQQMEMLKELIRKTTKE